MERCKIYNGRRLNKKVTTSVVTLTVALVDDFDAH